MTICTKFAIIFIAIIVCFERGDFKFSGYLCKPTFSKSNRTYQTLIINGRYVINQTISTAIYKAYENYVTEEKKSQEEQQAEYQEQYDVNSMKNDAMNKFKAPDINSITRGMTNSIPKFSIPKI